MKSKIIVAPLQVIAFLIGLLFVLIGFVLLFSWQNNFDQSTLIKPVKMQVPDASVC
jgi:hypothetical protein